MQLPWHQSIWEADLAQLLLDCSITVYLPVCAGPHTVCLPATWRNGMSLQFYALTNEVKMSQWVQK